MRTKTLVSSLALILAIFCLSWGQLYADQTFLSRDIDQIYKKLTECVKIEADGNAIVKNLKAQVDNLKKEISVYQDKTQKLTLANEKLTMAFDFQKAILETRASNNNIWYLIGGTAAGIVLGIVASVAGYYGYKATH